MLQAPESNFQRKLCQRVLCKLFHGDLLRVVPPDILKSAEQMPVAAVVSAFRISHISRHQEEYLGKIKIDQLLIICLFLPCLLIDISDAAVQLLGTSALDKVFLSQCQIKQKIELVIPKAVAEEIYKYIRVKMDL